MIANEIPVLVCNAHVPSTRVKIPTCDELIACAVKSHKGAKRRRGGDARRKGDERRRRRGIHVALLIVPPNVDTAASTFASIPTIPGVAAGDDA